MFRAGLWCFLILLLTLSAQAGAQQGRPQTPPPGSAERAAILEALRAPVQKGLKKKVVFKVDHLKLQNGWAFLRGVPQQPGGKPMDYRGTPYQRAKQDGLSPR